jgi:hypothetical protein
MNKIKLFKPLWWVIHIVAVVLLAWIGHLIAI